jgi:hypothetical protein
MRKEKRSLKRIKEKLHKLVNVLSDFTVKTRSAFSFNSWETENRSKLLDTRTNNALHEATRKSIKSMYFLYNKHVDINSAMLIIKYQMEESFDIIAKTRNINSMEMDWYKKKAITKAMDKIEKIYSSTQGGELNGGSVSC